LRNAIFYLPKRNLTRFFFSLSESVFHPLVASASASPIILYLPPGPLLPTTASPTVDVAAALSSLSLSATVVQINYRCSQTHQYPTPVHDVLTGYDWVLDHLVLNKPFHRHGKSRNTRPKLAVCGELVGGSLATMLTLTECRVQGPYIAAAAINEPVMNWVFPDDGNEAESGSAADRFTSFIERLQSGRKKSRSNCRPSSFSTFAENDMLNASTLLKARQHLFRRPADYFDTFASPLFNLRTAGVAVPTVVPTNPLDEFAELALHEGDDFYRQQMKMSSLSYRMQNATAEEEEESAKTPRKSHRMWPNVGSGLQIPHMHMTCAVDSPLSDQSSEFARLIQKRIVAQEMKTVEAEGDDLAEEAAYMLAERQVYYHRPDDIRLWSLGHTEHLGHIAHWVEQILE
jgi:acetyl esterase/lipase